MSAPDDPARTLTGAEGAEVRKASDHAGLRAVGKCGRSAEEVRKLSLPVLPVAAADPSSGPPGPVPVASARPLGLVTVAGPEVPREGGPGRPSHGPAAAGSLVLQAGERTPGDGTPRELAECAQVLTHPTFDRPAVANERTPGRKAGAVSLAVVRRRKKAEAGKPAPGPEPAADGVASSPFRLSRGDPERFVRLFMEVFFAADPRRRAAELGFPVLDRPALPTGEPLPPEGALRELAERAQVLTHPSFDRPTVANECTPGRKAGAVSMAVVRRRKNAEAGEPGAGPGPGVILRGRT